MQQGFIDLRTNQEASDAGNESFWPSFTDIMTVVVMIFLLVSVVLILRNYELVAELRATITAEREASALVETTTEANITLEEQLAQAQHQISVMRMWLMQAREENESNRKAIEEKDQRLIALQTENRRVQDELAREQRRYSSLDEQLRQSTAELSAMRDAFTRTDARLRETLGALDEQLRANETQAEELATLRQASELSEAQLAELKGQYDSLKVKYDKLVQPARTAAGKQVVEVRYVKEGGRYRIGLREPGSQKMVQLGRKELNRRLDQLKSRYGKKLYVKIIIPEKSGLSYSEAWNFTRQILEGYDYYYQR